MSRIFVLAAGWINAALVLYHLQLAWELRSVAFIPFESQALMEMLNVATAIFVAFLAIASISSPDEMLTTRLGHLTIGAGVVMYASRALEEVLIAPEFSGAIFVVCLVVAALYTAAWSGRHNVARHAPVGEV